MRMATISLLLFAAVCAELPMRPTRGGWTRVEAPWSSRPSWIRARSCAPPGMSPAFDELDREDDMHTSKRFGWLLPWVLLTAASA